MNNNVKKIYVFLYDDKYKIGVSNNTEKRIKQLSCGCPGIRSIYESKFILNYFKVESILHRTFSDYRIGGEWFSKVNLDTIDEIINKSGLLMVDNSFSEPSKITNKVYYSQMLKKIFDIEKIENERKNIQDENIQIEKFTISVEGFDIPNIYSDLIYDIIFGENTESLLKKYKPNRFESFRKKLSDMQNAEIDKLTSLIGALINLYYDFNSIESVVRKCILEAD